LKFHLIDFDSLSTYKLVLEPGNISPESIQLLNAHGTPIDGIQDVTIKLNNVSERHEVVIKTEQKTITASVVGVSP